MAPVAFAPPRAGKSDGKLAGAADADADADADTSTDVEIVSVECALQPTNTTKSATHRFMHRDSTVSFLRREAAFDFAALEKHLIAGCKTAIALAVEEVKKNDPATFFAIDTHPYYGEFLPSFDTLSNSRRVIRYEQERRLERRDWMTLEGKDAWLETYDGAIRASVPMFNDEVGEFTHHMIHDCEYPLLDALAQPALPKAQREGGKRRLDRRPRARRAGARV
jgi:hypothetical protein